MSGTISNFNFLEAEAQKYWSFPSSYTTEKKHDQLNTMLYSNDYVASEKRDGYFQFIIKDDEGNVYMRARAKGVNGWVCKQDWVPQLRPFFDELPNGTCLVAEVYLPGKTSKAITTILGCAQPKAVERQMRDTYLRLSVFDVLAWGGHLLYSEPIVERITWLENVHSIANEYVDVVEYWFTPDEIHDNWLRILEEGGEGVVLTLKNNPYEFGKRTARHTLKLKKELQETIDVFLTGRWKAPTMLYTGKEIESWPYWYDELKEERVEGTLADRVNNDTLIPVTRLWFYNWAGAVEIATYYAGRVTPIGWISGIADDVRADIVVNPDYWKGKVVELQAMEIDHSGPTPTLRHAKIINWRTDKNAEDCIWQG